VLRFPQYHLPVQNKVHLFINTLKKKTIGKGKFFFFFCGVGGGGGVKTERLSNELPSTTIVKEMKVQKRHPGKFFLKKKLLRKGKFEIN